MVNPQQGEIDDAPVEVQARMMSQLMLKLKDNINTTVVICITQLRMKH
ncbi:hypothetical protein JBO39_23895 [Serratia marcescens]|nr:hypothetical protein [Serratia marcescens]MBL5824249.1 hypothetical protein [Serratia marcescens]MBN5380713.1 hypothetical protein [Serratia marcescens]HEB0104074.1 hypothetical protein [Serratia marcescens]